jgi:hypothetical protein
LSSQINNKNQNSVTSANSKSEKKMKRKDKKSEDNFLSTAITLCSTQNSTTATTDNELVSF